MWHSPQYRPNNDRNEQQTCLKKYVRISQWKTEEQMLDVLPRVCQTIVFLCPNEWCDGWRLTIDVGFDSVRNDANEENSSGLNLHE